MSPSAQLANAVQGARAIAAHGDKQGALVLLDQALDRAMLSLGGDDPEVLAATTQLARYHVDIGELNDARRVLEEGLAAGYHRLGDGHAVMLGLSYELARIADELGNVFEAKRRYNQLVKLGPQALGDGHPSVRAAREYLGLPEPEGEIHVPPPPPAVFDPVTPPPPSHRPAIDDRPIFRPEPREEPQPRAEPETWQPEPVQEEREPEEDDYRPAPWQQSAPGVIQRADYAPAPPMWPVQAQIPISAPPLPPPPAAEAPRPRRSPLPAIIVIIVVAVLGGGVAAAIAFKTAGGNSPGAGPAQTTAAAENTGPASAPASGGVLGNGRAPTGLQLRDDKTSITLTWKDPTKGTVPFVVAGGTQGAIRELQGLPAGTTKYTINGLNSKLDYCFTVAAVYGTQDVQLSDLACTQRK